MLFNILGVEVFILYNNMNGCLSPLAAMFNFKKSWQNCHFMQIHHHSLHWSHKTNPMRVYSDQTDAFHQHHHCALTCPTQHVNIFSHKGPFDSKLWCVDNFFLECNENIKLQ